MQLRWTVSALTDRETIFDYIERDSPKAAIAVDDRIEHQVEALERFPEMGRKGRVEQTRELIVQRTPYIVAYCITGDTVRILRVLHGAQQWPEEISET